MYTIINRRKTNRDRQQETFQRAQSEFFPKLQNAPGLIGFYLVPDEQNDVTTAVAVWEDKAQADAFERAEVVRWAQVLDELGNTLESHDQGETVVRIEPQRQDRPS